jgi:hypothetical protein
MRYRITRDQLDLRIRIERYGTEVVKRDYITILGIQEVEINYIRHL